MSKELEAFYEWDARCYAVETAPVPDEVEVFEAEAVESECYDCGTREGIEFMADPYAEALDDEVELMWLCAKCADERFLNS